MTHSERLALISVTDKRGVVELGRALVARGYLLLSTGGTAKALREAGLAVREAAEHTSSPEILDGRVKTLHPLIHGGILFDRTDPNHAREASSHGIAPIDIVVVNLYRFAEEAKAKQLSAADAIHHIDIGGPAMLRAAAKNWRHCLAVCDPADYASVLAALDTADGPSIALRQRLAAKVFATVSAYDRMIASYLDETPEAKLPQSPTTALPQTLHVELEQLQALRYGENPHQAAGLFIDRTRPHQGFANLDLRQGKELSYNNILDLDAACRLAADLSAPACVIVKHTNPCGVATGELAAADLFRKALACDPKSAFGGIVALNIPLDAAMADALTSIFVECVAAPEILPEALPLLARKPKMRVLCTPVAARSGDVTIEQASLVMRSVVGAVLVQQDDRRRPDRSQFQLASAREPKPEVAADLEFAMTVAKHVKSNAIVLARNGATLGIGAGQMSRIDAARLAAQKARDVGLELGEAVLASDAFFPFRDTVDFAAELGIGAVIQPGGSLRDQESIDAANQHEMTMVFTGERHFRH